MKDKLVNCARHPAGVGHTQVPARISKWNLGRVLSVDRTGSRVDLLGTLSLLSPKVLLNYSKPCKSFYGHRNDFQFVARTFRSRGLGFFLKLNNFVELFRNCLRFLEMRFRLTKRPLNPARIAVRVDLVFSRPARTCHHWRHEELTIFVGIVGISRNSD